MSKLTMCMVFAGFMMGATAYIVLNETGKLDKIKNQCYNKMMDIKDELKSKLD